MRHNADLGHLATTLEAPKSVDLYFVVTPAQSTLFEWRLRLARDNNVFSLMGEIVLVREKEFTVSSLLDVKVCYDTLILFGCYSFALTS